MKKVIHRFFSFPYYIWAAIFVILPMLLVIYYSFITNENGYMQITLDNYIRFFSPNADGDYIYIKVLNKSIALAFISTVICLVVAYPMSYIISRSRYRDNSAFLFLIIAPMWMNFLLRTYAWLSILEYNGIVNSLLALVGIPKINFLYNDAVVVLGMVYNFLPFMILPIYTILKKTDTNLVNAARDLGANSRKVFVSITFPLSLPGVISGIIMVFMPALTTFVISDLLGGKNKMLIGNLIQQQFLVVSDGYNFGSAIAVLLFAFILVSMILAAIFDKNEGGALL